MPLNKNTVSKRRNAPSFKTRLRLDNKGAGLACTTDAPCAAPLCAEKNQTTAGTSKPINTHDKRAVPTLRSLANTVGKVAANNTPIRPKPSRDAVSRVRVWGASVMPAPCAW